MAPGPTRLRLAVRETEEGVLDFLCRRALVFAVARERDCLDALRWSWQSASYNKVYRIAGFVGYPLAGSNLCAKNLQAKASSTNTQAPIRSVV